jgi:two-component system, LytTR family, response regulator
MNAPVSLQPEDFVYLNDSANCWLVHLSDIATLESEGNYVQIGLADGTTIMCRQTLQECAKKFDPKIFFQASRTCIVNFEHIKKVYLVDAHRIGSTMTNGKDVIFSKTQSVRLRRQIGL